MKCEKFALIGLTATMLCWGSLIAPTSGQDFQLEAPIRHFAAGDFNADGKPDLLVGDFNQARLPDTRITEDQTDGIGLAFPTEIVGIEPFISGKKSPSPLRTRCLPEVCKAATFTNHENPARIRSQQIVWQKPRSE
ncbi:MAG: hypothetical protein GY819_10340 [Planctomycetaceae bacterium]|nr:hypothetical protein [Planctomycetaceae bacterium]